MSTILKQINEEIFNFKNKNITIVPGLTFNQPDTIEKIYFYYHPNPKRKYNVFYSLQQLAVSNELQRILK